MFTIFHAIPLISSNLVQHIILSESNGMVVTFFEYFTLEYDEYSRFPKVLDYSKTLNCDRLLIYLNK